MRFLLYTAIVSTAAIGFTASTSAQMIVGHRGASADAPENTLAAFRLAFEQGADAVEGDCHLTSDQKIVFTHDRDSERVSGQKLKVVETPFQRLRELDVGSWKDPQFSDERMPTLAEVCAIIPPGKVFLIEVKCGPEIIPHLEKVLSVADLDNEQLRIISFNRDVVKEAKRALPDIECYWLCRFRKDKTHGHWYPTIETVVATALNTNADGVDVQANMKLVNESFVTACRAAGLSLHAWTVDDPEVAMQLRELGFDSITTNRPGFLRRALAVPAESATETLEPVGLP